MRDDSAEILFKSLLQEALVSSSGRGREVRSEVVHSTGPLPATELPTIQGALKDGFGEAVAVCNMPKPCKFPSRGVCRVLRLRKHF